MDKKHNVNNNVAGHSKPNNTKPTNPNLGMPEID